MLGNQKTLAWLTPHAAVAREDERVVQSWLGLRKACRFCLSADGKEIFAWARSHEHLLEICDIVLRLLAASDVHSVILTDWNSLDDALINAPTLAYLMEHCQSLKALALQRLEMDENHARVLGANSRPDLEIVLNRCAFTSAGTSTLIEVLGKNQGPTKLHYCDIDYAVLADGLRGNSRLKIIRQEFSEGVEIGNRQVLAIADAVRENKGLVELHLRCDGFNVNDETWGAICDSLKTHPTLQVLDLFATSIYKLPPVAPDMITSRMQTLVDMIKDNTSIHTILMGSRYNEHEIYRESVILDLVTNRFRPRVRAIQKTRPIAYRAKVLGRALLAARIDANRFWMLLSGNAEVAFPPRSTTIAAAANLPTPAITAATSTANVADVAASVVSALTTSDTSILPPAAAAAAASPTIASDAFASAPPVAAANTATPSAGQKRKARP
jgi:hypothetical protein